MGKPLKYNCSNCAKISACEPYIGRSKYHKCPFYKPTEEIVEHDKMINAALSIIKNSTFGSLGGHDDKQK